MKIMAAPFENLPYIVVQPNGVVIHCYQSGDEFFNWLHDEEGYPIIKGADGYYRYAVFNGESYIPSQYIVGEVNPGKVGMDKSIQINRELIRQRRLDLEIPQKPNLRKSGGAKNTLHTGTFNNLVIYIRFAEEDEIQTPRQSYYNALNQTTGYSLKAYYQEVSYNQLTIESHHYPMVDNPQINNASYMDSHPRNYFQPYNASTNPNGYNGANERRIREHQLLVDAIQWINQNFPIPSDLNIDADGDGYVDNICFMIKGESGEWADLLWAHRWALYSSEVFINGKRVWDYTFQPENQVGVRTLSHEMFHVLGAPDLYHYYNFTNIKPAGKWDIMNSGSGHMLTYMKWKYAQQFWISEIPVISTPGVYTLFPSTMPTNNCYKIPSPNSSDEYFVVEYRKFSGEFESMLPSQGLIVYRINPNFEGNAQYDGTSIFDEVYVYRPGGDLTNNGQPDSSTFYAASGRITFNDATNPSSFLTYGNPGGINIYNVSDLGDSITFNVSFGLEGQLVIIAQPSEGGQPLGAGTYPLGGTATLTANPNQGWQFVLWLNRNDQILGTPSVLNYAITQTVDTVKAVYRQVVSIDDVEHNLTIFPNPFKNKINIPQDAQQLIIFTLDGRVVFSAVEVLSKTEIDLSFLLPGIYLIHLENNTGRQMGKIIKME